MIPRQHRDTLRKVYKDTCEKRGVTERRGNGHKEGVYKLRSTTALPLSLHLGAGLISTKDSFRIPVGSSAFTGEKKREELNIKKES